MAWMIYGCDLQIQHRWMIITYGDPLSPRDSGTPFSEVLEYGETAKRASFTLRYGEAYAANTSREWCGKVLKIPRAFWPSHGWYLHNINLPQGGVRLRTPLFLKRMYWER